MQKEIIFHTYVTMAWHLIDYIRQNNPADYIWDLNCFVCGVIGVITYSDVIYIARTNVDMYFTQNTT